MRAVVQRVGKASVSVGGERISEIGRGLLVLLGIARDDDVRDMEYIADKCLNLRVFEDENEVMNRSLLETEGELLLVSQFTLMGDARKGRRPSYLHAAPPEQAKGMFQECVRIFRGKYEKVSTGKFQAMMEVALVNDGPVTILLDSKKEF